MKPPYEITTKILELYGQITEALGVCKSLLLVKPEARLRRQNRIKTIYSSLAIEGNSLNIEHVSALIDNKRVAGPKKDILEIQNAIAAYDHLNQFKPHSIKDFLKTHDILMAGLVENPGRWRKTQVGIFKGKELAHIAPGFRMVPGLMQDLFEYIKNDKDIDIIKSCVFHYEMEFIHPFEDGNGRMGRFWQTMLLMNVNPIFEYIPIEETIRNHQREYYKVLSIADKSGSSTLFIEFILKAINSALRNTIEESKIPRIGYRERTEHALSLLDDWFDRKEYMKTNKGISTATASRDLKQLLQDGVIEAEGNRRMTRYRKK
ncbi:Fic family protein [Treponema primitia]|uniref:Fic family protein n=1 Tax=Treponema primitia TaxID=88058 RepID=UPI00397EC3E3